MTEYTRNNFEIDIYKFNTSGMVIWRNLFSQDIVDEILSKIDTSQKRSLYIDKIPKIAMEFMSHDRTIRFLKSVIGLWLRFDHDLAVNQTSACKAYLHGGQFGSHGTCTYRYAGGGSWNGQVTVGMALSHQDRETGGFSYIPGSHHDVMQGQYGNQMPIWDQMLSDGDVEVPTLNPGDVYVFSEALIHGQSIWKREEPRSTLYMKYVPGYMAWQDPKTNESYLKHCTNKTHELLLCPPYTRKNTVEDPIWRENVR